MNQTREDGSCEEYPPELTIRDRLRAAGWRAQHGASLVEYALLVSLIAMVCVLAVQFFGGNVSGNVSKSASSLSSAR